MTANDRIRVLVHCCGPRAALLRTLASLAGQSLGPRRLDVVLASTAPRSFATPEGRLLCGALGFGSLRVLDATGLSPAAALNLAARDADQGVLALAPEGSRLSPRFMGDCLAAMAQDGSQAAYAAHTAGSPGGSPLLRLRPFRPGQLSRMNPVGPAALVRVEAWKRLGGLRPGLRLALWDFWLRLAFSGGGIAHVQRLLAFCPPAHRLPASLDGRSKALLVTETPGAFAPDVCRWALALLRGDSWASAFVPGMIPSPGEVRAMFAPSAADTAAGWGSLGLCGA